MYHIAGSEKNDTKVQNKTKYLIGDTKPIEKISGIIVQNIQNKILWVGNLVNCIQSNSNKKHLEKLLLIYFIFSLTKCFIYLFLS